MNARDKVVSEFHKDSRDRVEGRLYMCKVGLNNGGRWMKVICVK